MKKNDLIYIEDILTSMKHLEDHVTGVKPDIFYESIDIQDKALFRLILIGEEANKVSDETKKLHPEIPWRKIIGLRNIIVHDYSGVALERIWNTITSVLPKTKKDFEKLKLQLDENKGD